jgi:uncharacterized peroxidase-related enzyme
MNRETQRLNPKISSKEINVARLEPIPSDKASGKAKELLEAVKAKMGMTPNILTTMANAPAVLKAYLNFSQALSEGVLPPKLREQIALAVSEANGCQYCVSAHAAIAHTIGLSDTEILQSRRGASPDEKIDVVLKFARTLVEKRGWASDEDVEEVRKAGFNDEEIAEILGNVALSFFTNYFNHMAGTETDFPKVPELEG